MSEFLEVIDLGLCPYGKAWEIQKDIHSKRLSNLIGDTIIFVEHPHVYTLGKNAKESHLLASEEYLKRRGIELYRVDRGGDITYHGPGQLVGYPIFNLKEHRLSVGWFVNSVEEVIIEALKEFGIEATRQANFTGVWVQDKKIAAIGMRVAKWVTMHGFALNVTTDLRYFSGIIPCGIANKGVTRIIDWCPNVKIEEVKERIINQFIKIFGFKGFISKG